MYNDINKVRTCRSVWGALLYTYHQLVVLHCHELIRGAVYITKLEKVEMIDGEIHQECSLEDSWKTRKESWPVHFLS